MNETTQNPPLKKPTFSWGMWEVMQYSMCWTARRASEEESGRSWSRLGCNFRYGPAPRCLREGSTELTLESSPRGEGASPVERIPGAKGGRVLICTTKGRKASVAGAVSQGEHGGHWRLEMTGWEGSTDHTGPPGCCCACNGKSLGSLTSLTRMTLSDFHRTGSLWPLCQE